MMTQVIDATDLMQFGYNPVTDTCDCCTAKAKIVVFVGKGLLLFCRHHHSKHAPGLAAKGLEGQEFDAN